MDPFLKGAWLTDLTILNSIAEIFAPNSIIEAYTKKDHTEHFNGEPCVAFLNHNCPSSWIQFVAVAGSDAAARMREGTAVKSKAFALFHQALYSLPLFSALANRYSVKVTKAEDIASIIKKHKNVVFGTCPEGDNCFFDFENPIAPFRQYGLIKMSLELGVKICIFTSHQEKAQSVSVKVPLLNKLRKGATALRLPFVRPTKLLMTYSYIKPSMSPKKFAELSAEDKRIAIAELANKVRDMMIRHHGYLEDVSAGDAALPSWE